MAYKGQLRSSWYGTDLANFRAPKRLIRLVRRVVNHVDFNLVYTSRGRLRIIHRHGGVVIEARFVFDGSMR